MAAVTLKRVQHFCSPLLPLWMIWYVSLSLQIYFIVQMSQMCRFHSWLIYLSSDHRTQTGLLSSKP